MRTLLCILFSLLTAVGAVRSQDLPARDRVVATSATAPGSPASEVTALPGSRVLRTFDFEEIKLGNYESFPMYWSKAVGRGYPAYSTGEFDHHVFRSANSSFRLETRGGSVAYRFTPPPDKSIAVHPDSDYYVLAFVRTAGLKYARANLTAWFAGEDGTPLPETELHSQPYTPGGPASGDAWQVLYIFMPGPEGGSGAASKARTLVFQAGLLQPQQLGVSSAAETGNSGLGRFEIYQQDIQGTVWFDDIVVFQLPRVGVSVPRTVVGNIFGSGQKVELDLVVSDLGAGSGNLNVQLRITDAEGLVFASERWNAATAPDKAWMQRFSHAPLPAGLYTATLEVADARASPTDSNGLAGGIVARRQAQFLCLPPAMANGMTRAAPEFGVGIRGWRRGGDPLSMAEAAALWPPIVRHTHAGLVQLPAWRREMSDEALTRRDQPFDTLLANLQRLDVHILGSFSEVPRALAGRLPPLTSNLAIPPYSLLAVLNADAALWRPYLSFTLTRYANRVDQWELGSPDEPFSGDVSTGSSPSGDLTERYAKLYERTYGEVASLLNRPQLLIPWNALFDLDGRQFPNALLDLRLPSVIKPSQIPAYIENFRVQSAATPPTATGTVAPPPAVAAPVIAHIEPLETAHYTHAVRLADFAQRVVFARSANPQAVLYDLLPASVGGAPDELLLVYRTLIQALGNSVYVGELPLAPGVRAFLFNRNGSGTLVLWNEMADSARPGLDLPLGATPRVMDIYGNAAALPYDPASGLAHVTVASTPVILDQLDPRPLQLKTSFSFATTTLPAGVGTVRTEVVLTNPYSDTITARLRMEPPKGWTTDPSTLYASIAPGATYRRAVTIRYPFTENAGPKQIDGRLSIEGGLSVKAQLLNISAPLTITSDFVEMEGFTQMLDNGDVIIQQMVTNIASAPLNAQAYALLPGYPRQQRYVLSLPPGQTAIKRFVFPASALVRNGAGATELTANDIARALAGKTATLGLRQNDGQTLLTKTIPLE